MHSWTLLRQAQYSLDQVLPSVQTCLDSKNLAAGELKLYNSQVQEFLETQFYRNAGPAITERISYFYIQITINAVPGSGHWLSADEIMYCPQITATVGFLDHREQTIDIRRSISLIMD